jgi:hypothetical protein
MINSGDNLTCGGGCAGVCVDGDDGMTVAVMITMAMVIFMSNGGEVVG